MGGTPRFAAPFPSRPQIQALANRPRERERWLVARLLGLSPFEERVLSLTVPQLEWILAQDALDDPPPPPDPVSERFEAKRRELDARIGAKKGAHG